MSKVDIPQLDNNGPLVKSFTSSDGPGVIWAEGMSAIAKFIGFPLAFIIIGLLIAGGYNLLATGPTPAGFWPVWIAACVFLGGMFFLLGRYTKGDKPRALILRQDGYFLAPYGLPDRPFMKTPPFGPLGDVAGVEYSTQAEWKSASSDAEKADLARTFEVFLTFRDGSRVVVSRSNYGREHAQKITTQIAALLNSTRRF